MMFTGLYICVISYLINLCFASKTEFDVIPGGTVRDFEANEGEFGCKFQYSCQGGTKEKWVIEILGDSNARICGVYRPGGGSYLFFQQFKLTTTRYISHVDAEGLSDSEFEVIDGKTAVTNSGSFKNKLTSLIVITDSKQDRGDL